MPLKVVRRELSKPATPEEQAAGLARLLQASHISAAGCWQFQKSLNHLGYGQLYFQGDRWMAHRLAWVLAKGPIPPGIFVCHKCDNPGCVNPEHLFLGDHTTNQRDMIAKNRHSKGRLTHCKRGHPLSGDNLADWRDDHRACLACNRGRFRVAAGWPEDLAYSMPPTPKGFRPIGASWVPTRAKQKRLGATVTPSEKP